MKRSVQAVWSPPPPALSVLLALLLLGTAQAITPQATISQATTPVPGPLDALPLATSQQDASEQDASEAVTPEAVTPEVQASPGPATPRPAGEPLLRVVDPAGDALGEGGARLPVQPAISPDSLDLRLFEVWPRGRFLTFRVEFGALSNPWNAPGGFSAQTLDIFIGTRTGGEEQLGDLNMQTQAGGWQRHLRVTGFGGRWISPAPAGASSEAASAGPDLPTPRVYTEGRTLVIDTDLPRGRYAYWVTSSVYSPLSAGGVLTPGGSGPFSVAVQGRPPLPVPLDILSEEASPQPFTLGRVPAVGRVGDLRPWWLWGLGLGALALAAGASAALWRTPRERVTVPYQGPVPSRPSNGEDHTPAEH